MGLQSQVVRQRQGKIILQFLQVGYLVHIFDVKFAGLLGNKSTGVLVGYCIKFNLSKKIRIGTDQPQELTEAINKVLGTI